MRGGEKESNSIFLEADEFLRAVAEGHLASKTGGRRVVVRGDLDLRLHPLRKSIINLPNAVITGNLIVDETCNLETCKCLVIGEVVLSDSPIEEFTPFSDPMGEEGIATGKVTALRCKRLKKITGLFGGEVNLGEAGVEEISEDFSCKGNLSLIRCMELRLVNCRAAAIAADESSLSIIGPGAVTDNLSVKGCSSLKAVTPIEGLRWAKYDDSGVIEVHPQFRCAGPAYFKRCLSLVSISGRIDTVVVSLAALEQADGLRVSAITFTDCQFSPEGLAGMRAEKITFNGCSMKELPRGIPTAANLTVDGCPEFSKLPARWAGGISLYGLPSLRVTPPHFVCGGKLDIAECETLIRVGGKIGGDLYLMDGMLELKELRDDLLIEGDLWLSQRSKVETIGCRVDGGVWADGVGLRSSTTSFSVGGDAVFRGCNNLEILRGDFGGKVILDEAGVICLGADFQCKGDLSLLKTRNLTSLNCSVGGNVLAIDSSIEKTGPAFLCKKNFKLRNCPHFAFLRGNIEGRTRIGGEIRRRIAKRKTRGGGDRNIEAGGGGEDCYTPF